MGLFYLVVSQFVPCLMLNVLVYHGVVLEKSCWNGLKDDEAIGADVGSIRSKFLEVHFDCVKKTQEYDTMYAEHTRISQVSTTTAVSFVSL